MDDKEVFNPQSGERIAPKKAKKFWKDWRFYIYTVIAVMLAIVSVSSMVTACAAINAGVGQSEAVSSQYKVKHNAMTTTEGGYTAYSFAFRSMEGDLANNRSTYRARVWEVDTADYSLNLIHVYNNTLDDSYSAIGSVVNSVYNSARPSVNVLNFMAVEGRNVWDGTNTYYWSYFSFVGYHNPNMIQVPFILTNRIHRTHYSLTSWASSGSGSGDMYILNSEQSRTFLASSTYIDPTTDLTFQDAPSYFSERGYQDGYSAGETAGYSSGYHDGYSAGETAGYAEGYEAGETHAYETLQTGIAFETYGMYADAKITLVADRTEGSYYYMDLFDYVTDTNIERSVYVLYIQNASNSTWLGYVQDVNASDSSGATYDIGSFTGATSTNDVVFTALMDRNLWEGAYITSFHGHAEAVNNAFWFTGGSYAATQQIYQDGYGEGYDVGRNDGYDIGYDAGVQVGRSQGLNEAEPESLTNTLVAVFQQPFNQLYRFFNFNVLGLNVLGIVSGLVSVLVVVKVFRKLYK